MGPLNPFSDDAGKFMSSGYGSDYASYLDSSYEEFYNRMRQDALEDRAYNSMREDTAYQRAFADLEKAGINPLAAVASGMNVGTSSQQNSQIAGTSARAREISGTYLKIFDNIRNASLQDAKGWSEVLRNVGSVIMPIVGLFA